MNSDHLDAMDPSLLQLERELASLTPAKPDVQLTQRATQRVVGAAAPAFTPVHRADPRVVPFAWRRVAVPAAAAAVVVAAISQSGQRGLSPSGSFAEVESRTSPVPAPGHAAVGPVLVPAGVQREVRLVQDHGYFYDSGQDPVHGFSWEAMDHHTYLNPTDNSSIRLSIPRDARALVPVSFH